jgi:phosphopantetheine adenylyltransferase
MNSLVKSLIFPLLESEQKGVALIPGGFKPPTIGHFVLVDEVAQNPNFDKVIVLIGHKVRDGVTKEESLAIWDIYKKYLPSNVEIKISDNSSPIADISSLIKNNPDTYFYPVVGIRGEMDLGDIKRFDSLEGKYPNFKTIVIKTEEGEDRVSGTKTRAALISGEKDKFQSYLPTELSQEEKDGVWSILTKTPLNEVLPKNENLSSFDLSPFDFDQDGNESRIKRTINNNQGWRRLGSDSEQNKQIKAYLDKYTSNFKWSNPPISEKFSKENKSMYNTPYVMYVHLLQTSEGVNNIKEALQGMIANEPDNTQKIIENALLLVFNNDEAKFKLVVEQYKDIIEKNAGDDDGANPFAAIKYAVSNFKDKKGIFNKFVRNGWSAGTFNLNETFFKNFLNEGYAEPSKFDYPKQLKALTEFMLDKGMNIRPLPKVKFIENDVENARNFFGKTAYYDPNQRVIVLYTMDRHPKDIMRSFAHEMIHHMQNCENRLGNISTTDINEDDYLYELEKEANTLGTMTFREYTDTITEWIVDTSKYNYTPKLSNKIFSQLHELKVNEIDLNPNNAVEIYGDLFSGEFKVGNIEYIYSIKNIPSPYKDEELFYNIQFDEKNNNESSNEPTRNARENYIKILSTMYKILLDFVEQEKPEYIGISSLDKSGYGNIYNNLTKTNTIPGYSRKDAGLDFVSKSGEKGKFIVLKKSIIDITEDILKENIEEEDNGTLLYKSIFKPDINILVAFKNYENYKILKPLFNKYGYGFYSPEDKIIILNGERFINSNLDFKDLKFVEAHEITHLLLGHTGPYSEEDEMDADLGAYILLKNKKLSTDRLVNEFENRHGVPFTEELLERVKNRL